MEEQGTVDVVDQGTEVVDSTPDVQPTQDDFIQPYLEGVDENVRPTVQEVLTRFRSEQDAQVNKKFQEYNSQLDAYRQYAPDPSELEIPVALYESLVQDPIGTLNWVAERFQEEGGRDLRSELLQTWQQTTDNFSEADAIAEATDPSNKPLTVKELEQWEKRRTVEAQQAQRQQQRMEQAKNRTLGWLDSALKQNDLSLTQDDPITEAVILHASRLHQSGQVANGQQAIEMAVEAFAQRLKNQKQPTAQPKVAEGGQAPPPKPMDMSDEKQRREYMLARLSTQE